MKKKLFKLSLLVSLLGFSNITLADTVNGQNINPFTGQSLPEGHVALPDGAYSKVPDALNWSKINLQRDCSPAELLAGKTSCNRCDPDVPNVVKPYTANLAQEMAKNGGIFIYGEAAKNMYTSTSVVKDGYIGQYLDAFDYKAYTGSKPSNINTTPKQIRTCSSKNDDCYYEPVYILYRGYNLQGTSSDFSPMNNRTVCELTRPQTNNTSIDANDGDKNKYSGAKVLGLAGLTIGLGSVGANWLNTALFNSKGAMGKQNNVANTIGQAGASISFLPTQMFACLEYYTGSNNPNSCGGEHVIDNQNGKAHFCQKPLQTYYNTKVAEIYCHHGRACDGVNDGVFAPATLPLRRALLMTNQYYGIGNTAAETERILKQRPLVCSF